MTTERTIGTDELRIFGTDGIRGRAGEGWLSLDRVSALGRAAGLVLGGAPPAKGRGRRAVLLGHDGRRSGPEIVDALARGFASRGFDHVSTGLITTPGLALLTRMGDWSLGAMVSASHNPAEDNGIKLFSSDGEKLSDESELEIERELRAHSGDVGGEPVRSRVDHELEMVYLRHLLETGGGSLQLDGMNVVLDCANGGASRIAPRVLGRLGARVTAIHAEPDGSNINQGCGSTHPAALHEAVRATGADIGIALDGDGDRCILVDERAELIHGDGILTMVARWAAAHGEYTDPRIVATVMSNRGLHRALREVGIGIVEVGVGDRRVVEALRDQGLKLGGEQSGHIIFGGDNHFIGDGIYTALRVLRILRESGKPLSELVAPYQPLPQVLLNIQVPHKPALEGLPGFSEACTRLADRLGEDGRVLVRYSGTEDLARVMVEGPDGEHIRRGAQELAELLSDEIGRIPGSPG